MYDKAFCPKCKAHLLVYLGDWDDCTSPTVEAAVCPTCQEHFLMGDRDAQEQMLEEIITSHCDVDGNLPYKEWRKIIRKMIAALLGGDKWEEMNLSQFLKEHAYTEVGQLLP